MGHIPTLHFADYAQYCMHEYLYKRRLHRVENGMGRVMWQLPNTLEHC